VRCTGQLCVYKRRRLYRTVFADVKTVFSDWSNTVYSVLLYKMAVRGWHLLSVPRKMPQKSRCYFRESSFFHPTLENVPDWKVFMPALFENIRFFFVDRRNNRIFGTTTKFFTTLLNVIRWKMCMISFVI